MYGGDGTDGTDAGVGCSRCFGVCKNKYNRRFLSFISALGTSDRYYVVNKVSRRALYKSKINALRRPSVGSSVLRYTHNVTTCTVCRGLSHHRNPTCTYIWICAMVVCFPMGRYSPSPSIKTLILDLTSQCPYEQEKPEVVMTCLHRS